MRNEDAIDKNNQPEVGFDVSDISNIVCEMDNHVDKVKLKKQEKSNKEDKINSSFDLSDDG